MAITLTTRYYEQFDADFSREIPAESFGGWKTTRLEISQQHTAVVIMHAWEFGSFEDHPGWHRAVEYIPRAREICRTLFPPLLAAVRGSQMHLFHVVEKGSYYQDFPGYERAVSLTDGPPHELPQIDPDPVFTKLRDFKARLGSHNRDDIQRGFMDLKIAEQARPVADEGIAENGDQLFALCREHQVNHLIYAGFAVNWCLLLSPGGMAEMRRHGLICSVLQQAVTAVENRETARRQLAKEMALWRIALDFGFVFDADELIAALGSG